MEEGAFLFKREHHLRIAVLLQSLDGDALAVRGCLFGGGTAIVLSHGEYRESVDLDFLVSDSVGYRDLRLLLTAGGMQKIAKPGSNLTQLREIRADQYGIRTLLDASGVAIKFEIILEGRIELESFRPEDRICGVATLAPLDMTTTKLLANSDRWADDSVFSRDLIDLAMLAPSPRTLKNGIEKASKAYGESIKRDLAKAIERLRNRPGRLDECMAALKMDSIPKVVLWKRIRELHPK